MSVEIFVVNDFSYAFFFLLRCHLAFIQTNKCLCSASPCGSSSSSSSAQHRYVCLHVCAPSICLSANCHLGNVFGNLL